MIILIHFDLRFVHFTKIKVDHQLEKGYAQLLLYPLSNSNNVRQYIIKIRSKDWMELHLVKVIVQIDSVKINIRFPGQLSFQLKNAFLFQDINKLFPLTNGCCEVGQAITFQTQAIYSVDSQTYSDIAVDLIISVNTISGKIVAGSVTFNVVDNKTKILPLKRCSDKNAVISLSITHAKINKIKDIEGKSFALKTIEKLQTSPVVNLASPNVRNNAILGKSEVKEKGDRSNSKSSHQKFKSLMGSRGKTIVLDTKIKELEQSSQRRVKAANKEKEDTQIQLEQVREKWRATERKEREALNVIKQLKQGNQKKKIKITDLQAKYSDHERIIQQNQKRLKQLQQQLKQSKQYLQQAQSKNVILEKKLEVRDQASNEREKRLLEKLQQCEIEHNKATFQYNQLLEKMESQQKTNQNLTKIKDRTYIEEKSKLKQALERLQQQNKFLKQQISQNNGKQYTISQLQQRLSNRIKQLQKQSQAQSALLQAQKNQLDKQTYARIQFQREVQKLKEMQADKGLLKKKLADLSHENQKNKDKLDKITIDYQQMKEENNKYQVTNQQLRKEKKALIHKSSQLERTNSTLERQMSRIQTEINGLSAKNSLLNERVADFKTKFQQQQNEFDERQQAWMNKFNSIMQSKEYVLSDAEDLKWALQREKERVAEAERRLKEKNQLVLQQEEELINLQKQIDRRSIIVTQYEDSTSNLRREIEEIKQKQRLSLQSVKESEKKGFEMSKKIAQIEQSYFFNLNKLQIQKGDHLESIRTHQVTIKELTEELTSKKESISDLQNDYDRIQEQFQQLSRNFKLQSLGMEEAEKVQGQGKQELAQLKKLNEELKRSLDASLQKISNYEQQNKKQRSNLKQRLQQNQRGNKTKQIEIQNYKKAVEQLLMIISKNSQCDEQIIAFPDKDLSKIQLEALLKRNKLISSLTNKITELEVEISYLQKENENKTKNYDKKIEEYQDLIKFNKQKHAEQIKISQQKQSQMGLELQNNSSEIKNLISQKQKLQTKVKGLREMIQEIQSEKKDIQSDYQKSKEQIKQLQSQLLKSKSIKSGFDQHQVQEIKLSFSRDIETYKEKINSVQKQKEKIEKSNSQKEKQILLLNDKIKQIESQLNYKDENTQNVKKSFDKLTNEKNALDQLYQQLQKNNNTVKDKLENTQHQLISQRELKSERQKSLILLREQVSDLSILKEKFENKLLNTQTILENTTNDLKNKISALESNYQNEQKKNQKLAQKMQVQVNQLQIKYFQINQLQQKLSISQTKNSDFTKENEEKRNQILKLTQTIEKLKRQIQGITRQKSEHAFQKDSTFQLLERKKKQVEQLYIQSNQLKNKIQNLTNQLQTIKSQNQELNKERSQLINNNNQLKQTIAEAKKDVFRVNARENQLKRMISSLQQQLKEKEEFYQTHKSKNWDEAQRQINSFKEKAKKSENKYQQMLKIWQQQKEELKYQVQGVLQDRDQLEGMLQDRERLIEQQQLQILQGQKRVISLNSELRNCLQAWEKQKNASLPSRRQADKIQQDLSRFQQQIDRQRRQFLGH